VLISIVQRHTALTAPQKALLQELSSRSEHNFKRLDDIEWVVTKEKLAVTVAVRLRAKSGVFRARATAATLSLAAHEALTRVLTQRRRTKRKKVDRRDDETVKGVARRKPAKR
jgi:ribosome-associated translation inhibitor RaiA